MTQSENLRFTKIHYEFGTFSHTEETSIFRDNETGVLYFMVTRGGKLWHRANAFAGTRWKANR